MMRARMLALLALQAGLAGVLSANPAAAQIDYAAERAAIGRYQDVDQRLQDTGWRLAAANAAFCPRVVPSIGLQLQDMASYGAPAIARKALGLKRDFAVQTAAKGSPASLAGAFTRNREIAALERFDPNDWPSARPMDWERLVRAHDHVEAMLTEHGGIAITFADGAEVRIAPVEVCASRFELMGDGARAVADGARVVMGIHSPHFGFEEPLFAAAVAHELAHNVLRHDGWLDRNGRASRNVRRIEREADRLAPWILANAGYDPAESVRFMRTWGKANDAGLKLRRTHDGWDERARLIAAEAAIVADLMAREGRADWATHFQRAINPDGGLEPAPKR